MVTHQPEASAIADRVVRLEEGRVLADAVPADASLFRDPAAS